MAFIHRFLSEDAPGQVSDSIECQLLYVHVCCGLNVYSQNLPRIFSKDERKALHSEVCPCVL